MLERLFQLRANGTTVGREIRGGLVTFLTLSYILFVQQVILVNAVHDDQPPKPAELAALKAGEPIPPQLAEVKTRYDEEHATYRARFKEGVFVATCVGSAIACLLMALLANYPFALAPAMGHNVFFAFIICGVGANAFGLTWQEALAANFISGAAFILLSFVGLRRAVMEAVPEGLKYAIAVGIGFLIAFVGLQYGGLVADHPAVLVQRGDLTSPVALLTLAGLVVLMVFLVRKVRGALLWGILITGAIALAVTHGYPPLAARLGWPELPYALAVWQGKTLHGFPTATFMQLDFGGLFSKHFVDLLIIIFILLFLDLFDTVGTLLGLGERAGMLVAGKLPRAGRALFSDAAGTVVGTMFGTSTITSYIESAAGVAEGARTGLANVVTAGLLLVSLVAYPVVSTFGQAVGGAYHPVLAPVLIVIGSLMMGTVAKIRWGDYAEAIPAFLTMVIMLFSLSIADGIAWGFIAYTVLKVASGKSREVPVIVYVVSALALLRYVVRPV